MSAPSTAWDAIEPYRWIRSEDRGRIKRKENRTVGGTTLNNGLTDDEKFDVIRERADELGRTPTLTEMWGCGPYQSSTPFVVCEDWPATVAAAGLEPLAACIARWIVANGEYFTVGEIVDDLGLKRQYVRQLLCQLQRGTHPATVDDVLDGRAVRPAGFHGNQFGSEVWKVGR